MTARIFKARCPDWFVKKCLLTVALALMLAPAAAAVNVHDFVRGSWQHIRKAYVGKPLVVHFWGVTCGPCRAEMPRWGKFLKERPGLHLVTVDADLVPNAPTAVEAMLKASGLSAADNWMFADDFVERLRYEIDPRWQGEIPMTLLIAPDGATVTIEGVADFAAISAWLDRRATPVR